MEAKPLDNSIRELIETIEEWERIDSPWLFEEIKEAGPQPVFGKGGKPTGKMKITGRQALQQMEIQMGRSRTPAGANPRGAGMELPDRDDKNRELLRRQQAAVNAILGPLDTVATAMKRKWGVGRLETLVSEEWALKFHTAADKLAKAVAATDMVGIREKAEVMRRGWIKLDELATEAGAAPWCLSDIWEVRAPNGTVYAIARTDFDQWSEQHKDGVAMYTLAEVARVLQAWDEQIDASELKRVFPDARVTKAVVPPIELDDVPF